MWRNLRCHIMSHGDSVGVAGRQGVSGEPRAWWGHGAGATVLALHVIVLVVYPFVRRRLNMYLNFSRVCFEMSERYCVQKVTDSAW